MGIEIGFTKNQINTHYAPLAVLLAHYQINRTLEPLAQVSPGMKTRVFRPLDKLVQILVSILAGCETISEVNTKLDGERPLAAVGGWPRFTDQSNLSRLLDRLTLKQIAQLRQATTVIWRRNSCTGQHDWRGYLWLDFDLSGLPCSPRAQASQKGYFSGKKTLLAAS